MRRVPECSKLCRVASLAALLFLLLSSPLLAAVVTVDDYIQRSGLGEELELIAGKMLRKIEEAQVEPDADVPRLSAGQMERVRTTIKVALSGDRVRLAIRSRLEALLVRGDAEVFVNWLNTPFGKRVTAIEVAGAALEAPRRATENPEHALAALTKARKDVLERILKASGVEDRTATMELQVDRIMAFAAGASVPDIRPAYSSQNRLENPLQDRLEVSRRKIAIALAPKALAYVAVLYSSLSDDELRDYATVLERPSTRRVNDALNDAFDSALSAAAIEVGTVGAEGVTR